MSKNSAKILIAGCNEFIRIIYQFLKKNTTCIGLVILGKIRLIKTMGLHFGIVMRKNHSNQRI